MKDTAFRSEMLKTEIMQKKAATFFSYLFHPLIMPTLGIMILMFSGSYSDFIPLQARRMLIMLAALGTFALPALMIPVFILRGSISSATIGERRERLFPLAVTFVFYLLTFLLFMRIPVYRFIHAFMLGTLLSVAMALLVTMRWKISTHLIGLGGLTALIIFISLFMDINLLLDFTGLILIAGVTASSRVYLEAHDQAQVYTGYFAGFVVMLVTLMVY